MRSRQSRADSNGPEMAPKFRKTPAIRRAHSAILFLVLSPFAITTAAAQDALPPAPIPAAPVPPSASPMITTDATTFPLRSGSAASACAADFCTPNTRPLCCEPPATRFGSFLHSETSHAMTRRQKLALAERNTIDPFNFLTIVGTSAIYIGSDSHTAYGPGLKGFAKNSGVVFTEGITNEFFGTFMIPSLAGQDPRYHRTPNAPMRHRIAHAIYQVVWTASDTGKPMFNYATVFGTIAGDAVNDLYVPGRKLGAGASAARIGTAIATDPIDNFITEFAPDVARRIKFRVVFLQRIINRVALQESGSASD